MFPISTRWFRFAGRHAFPPVLCGILALSALPLTAGPAFGSPRSELLYSKGLVLLHRKDYAGARDQFDAAVEADPGDARALYYRAMARGRLQDLQGAVDDLHRCLQLDPSLDRAHLELAYLESRLHHDDAAAENLAIARSRPAVAEDAQILAMTNESQRAAQAQSGRRYRLTARLGMEYDSNVPLAPDNDAARAVLSNGVSEGDGRATIDAGGVVSVYSSELVRVSARYDFEQSLHFDLSEFDIQTHRATVDVGTGSGRFRFGVRGSYAYTMNDGHDLDLEGVALPWLRILEGDLGNTDVYYRLRSRDFFADRYDKLETGLNNAAGVRQFFYLGRVDRYLMAGYRFDQEDPDHSSGSALGYDGHQAEAGIGWALTDRLAAQLIYSYRNENYHSPSAGREDDEHSVWLRGEAVLTPWASLVAGYRLQINDSNKKAFDYTDQIASLAVELSY